MKIISVKIEETKTKDKIQEENFTKTQRNLTAPKQGQKSFLFFKFLFICFFLERREGREKERERNLNV